MDSWKEVAAYLNRDPRTVRRWEHQEGLPVHRHLHGKKGSVYAFAHEIDAWRAGRERASGFNQLPLLPSGHLLQPIAVATSGTLRQDRFAHPLIIAVLPLRNLSTDHEQDRFADGLTEELVLELGQCCPDHLRVISSTSVAQYRQITKGAAQIGRELGADYILEGSIRRMGHRVRLAARLIAARDQAHIWAESYEIQLPPLFVFQQSLARELADSLIRELNVRPSHDRRPALAVSAEAHSAYLEARSYFLSTEEEFNKKLENLYAAIERDPGFARSYADLALVYFRRLHRDYPPRVALARVKENAFQARRLDPKLACAHSAVAASQLFGAWNWPETEKSSRRAIELNPSDVWAHFTRAAYHLVMGERELALQELEQAHQLAPQSLEDDVGIAYLTYLARDYDLAIERWQQVLQLEPSLPVARMLLGVCYAQKGDYQRALKACGNVTTVGEEPLTKIANACTVYAMAGQNASAQGLLRELVSAQETRYVRYFFLAVASANLGHHHETVNWLEKAFEQHDPLLVFLKASPRFASISSQPGFLRLARRIGLPG